MPPKRIILCQRCKNIIKNERQKHKIKNVIKKKSIKKTYKKRKSINETNDLKSLVENRRTTRSMTRKIRIYEKYRCMPLLGDEEEKNPGWEVHVANYVVVFQGKSK